MILPTDDDQQADPMDADGNLPSDDNEASAPDDSVVAGSMNMEEQDDGSMVISFEGEGGPLISAEFTENLAEIIPEHVLQKRATELLDLIEQDVQARSKRDEQYAEGIKRTGLGNEAPGGAEFTGASKAVHPLLVEGCIDFAARAMKEICPPAGPVKTQIIGKTTPAKLEKAERKRQHMNWQLTKCIREYKPETEKMLTQVPMGGSQYKKWWYDKAKGRPCVEAVFIDNLVIPFAASSFYTAERITHMQVITQAVFEERVKSGFYRDVSMTSSAMQPDQSKSEMATAKVEGKVDPGFNEDGERKIMEVSYYDTFEEDVFAKKKCVPYIMHIDESSGKCLAVYRNWEEEDKHKERLHWIIEYAFIPWRGAYGIGLPHIVGSLSGAITGGLRAMLDNALAQTRLGGVYMQGGRSQGATVQANPSEFTKIDSGVSGQQDDIRKMVMYAPLNPMPPVLFQILDWMVAQAKGVVQVADEKIADVKSDMPVGTALALIEQGSITFSQIHARMHYAQERELEILHRLNKWFLSDREVVEDLGDLVVSRKDYDGPIDVIPVSDPNIFSESQRYAQMQAVLQTLDHPAFAQDPAVMSSVKKPAILARIWKLLNISNVEELVAAPKEPEDIDPVSENMVVALGEQPIKAFQHQDHMAHMKVALSFATSPMFGANPVWGAKIVPILIQHVYEHLVLYYTQHMYAASITGQVVGVPGADNPAIDARFAAVVHYSDAMMSDEVNKEIGQMLQKAVQLSQQYAQQAQGQLPPDIQVQREIGMAEIKRKTDYDKQDLQIKGEQAKADAGLKGAQAQHDQTLGQQQQVHDQKQEHLKYILDGLTQHFKDQREQDRLASEEQRAKDKLDMERQIALMKDSTERAIAAMHEHNQHFVDLTKHAATEAVGVHKHHTQLDSQERIAETNADATVAAAAAKPKPAPRKFAEGGHVKADVDDFARAIRQQSEPQAAFGLTKLAQSIEQLTHQQAQSNQQLVSAVVNALSETKNEMRVVAAAAGAAAHGHNVVAQSFDKLDKTMRAPRKKVLSKDKRGNKTVVDSIDDGNE